MDHILDQSRDLNGRELWRLKSLYPVPDFVKSASREQLCGDGDLQSHQYADQQGRLYPIHTKPAVWASTAFLLDKQASIAGPTFLRNMERLEKAANFWGIRPLVEAMKVQAEKHAQDGTATLTDDDYAWISADDNGAKVRRLPLRNAVEVVKAAEWLATYRDDFCYWDRQKIATAILRKAARFGANVNAHEDMLEKVAGWGACAAKTAADLIRGRARHLKQDFPDVAGELGRMADLVMTKQAECRHPGMLQRIAAIVDDADRMAKGRTTKIAGNYSDALPRPEDVLFAVTRKQAEAIAEASVVNLTGMVYDKAALAGLRVRQVADFLGDDLAEAVSGDGIHVDAEKLAEVIATLTRPDAVIFDQLAQAAGLVPFGKQAATAPQGLTRNDLIRLAQGTLAGT